MSRLSIVVAAAAALLLPLRLSAQESAAPVTREAPAARSTVFFVQDDQATEEFHEVAMRTRPMLDALVLRATGQSEIGKAWRTLVAPTDLVGIKVTAVGGPDFSSHRGVVAGIVAGLEQAGIPPERIVIWDRSSEQLRTAGFASVRGGPVVRAVDPPRGLDRAAQLTAPVLGKLIWGDLLFHEKGRKPYGFQLADDDQLSSISHLASILSREVTKVINVPVFSDARGCGVAGALYNMTIPNIDNWRRFTQTEGPIATSPAALYADERIGKKVVLTILDGLIAQYAGGPGFDPNYAFAHNTLYASKDPVALDATALRKIEVWRKMANLPSIAKAARWLDEATAEGLGNSQESAILLQEVAFGK